MPTLVSTDAFPHPSFLFVLAIALASPEPAPLCTDTAHIGVHFFFPPFPQLTDTPEQTLEAGQRLVALVSAPDAQVILTLICMSLLCIWYYST